MAASTDENDRLRCPACGVLGDPADDTSFRLCGRDAARPVYRCAHCDAALMAGGADRASVVTPEVWQAMKAAWDSWHARAASDWVNPAVAAALLIERRARELERLLYEAYEPDEPPTGYLGVSFPDFVNGAKTLTLGLLQLHPDCAGLKPVMARFQHRFPLGPEAASAADELLRLAFWSLLACYLPDVSMDRHSPACRVLKVDELRTTSVRPVESLAGPLPTELLVWLVGADAARERTLAEAWARVVRRADDAAYATIENLY